MEFEETLKAAKERVTNILAEEDGWKLSSKSNENCKIESKLSDRLNCSIFRIYQYVKAPLKVVKDTLNFLPSGRRRDWDPDFKELILLKQVDDTTIVYVTRTNPVAKGVISPREFINLATWEDKDDFFQVIGCGVDYPEFQVDDTFVRGSAGCIMMKIEMDPSEPDQVCITTITEMDLKGRIPRYLVDSTLPGVMVASFNVWKKYLEKEGHLQS